MHSVRRLFHQVIDFANLSRAFRAASLGKRDQPEVVAFEYHLETRLLQIRRHLAGGTYRWGAYRRFLIHDPKRREIRAAPFRDRVVHHALVNVLDPVITRGFIADTYACIRGRGTHPAVQRYRAFVRARGGTGYALQCDILAYFASVDHRVLLSLLARRIGDPPLLTLLQSLIEHGAEQPGRGMPIGNLTSQMFADLYLDPLDHLIKETLRVRHYLRYMDDFILLVDRCDRARELLRIIEQFLNRRLLLQLNPRRVVISPLAYPRDFLGFVQHRDGRIRIRRRSDYGAGCSDTGNGCTDFYAVSVPGATPSASLTWFQAAAACRNAGKRLATNQEWQMAALGTPDPGTDNGTSDCNVSAAGTVLSTGSRTSCVSDTGAFDMVGNLWEWVADWGDYATGGCTNWSPTYGTDYSCVGGDGSVQIPGALIRGGGFGNGTNAGVFAVFGDGDPSGSGGDIGFRCAREP